MKITALGFSAKSNKTWLLITDQVIVGKLKGNNVFKDKSALLTLDSDCTKDFTVGDKIEGTFSTKSVGYNSKTGNEVYIFEPVLEAI